ncbi:DeoR/GlpR family DNA-binding transcription regulator [Calidifontibacter indicus]|uniref:DeoR/GlpR family DNA-binding transcription regulator n=1 Tax=Calidifontibacter indicus TaxID=419650 RepID=UPI003D720294
MYAAERHRRIVEEARRTGRVAVAELAGSLGVTPETVRRDLTSLEEHGTVRRMHGGAIPVERLEPTLATRTARSTDEKRRIAARALDEIPADGAVLLDSGSTTLAIAALIPGPTSPSSPTRCRPPRCSRITRTSISCCSADASAASPVRPSVRGPPACSPD